MKNVYRCWVQSSVGSDPTALAPDSVGGEGYDSPFAYDLDRTGSGPPARELTTEGEFDLYDWMGAPAVADGVAYAPLDSWGLQAVDLDGGGTVRDGPHRLPPDTPEPFLTSVTVTLEGAE